MLVPGDCYYLSVDNPGQITNVSTAAAGEYVVSVGRAISPTTLDIEIALPLLLSGNVSQGACGSEALTAVHDSATVVGQAVYVSSNGHVDLALADDSATASAIGLVFADTNAGETGPYVTEGQVERSDWTLVPGDTYFLSDTNPGLLTNVAPTSPGSYVTVIGRALSDNVLDLEISTCPVLLTGNVATGDSLATTLEIFTVDSVQTASGEIQLAANASAEFVFVNGLHQIVDQDYSISGSVISFATGVIQVGDCVAVKYQPA